MREADVEAIAEALDDLVMSKGVALDETRLDWLTDWIAVRIAHARREGAAEGWADALRWVRQYAENTTPDMAIEHIDRAEPFNPHRTALRGDA